MRKKIFICLVFTLLLSPAALAVERIPTTVAPSEQTVVAPSQAIDNAPALEAITIVHYKKGFVKPDGNFKRPPTPSVPSCYGFISGTAHLLNAVDLYINAAGSGTTTTTEQVYGAVAASVVSWDEQTSAAVFRNLITDITANFDTYYDGRNEISFGNYPQEGVIGVTRIWGVFSGKPSSRYLSGFDVLLDTDFSWGDGEMNPLLMDLQNILTHELGHGVGLGDVYEDACAAVTMYGYSSEGDVLKRTLEPADILGLKILYGN